MHRVKCLTFEAKFRYVASSLFFSICCYCAPCLIVQPAVNEPDCSVQTLLHGTTTEQQTGQTKRTLATRRVNDKIDTFVSAVSLISPGSLTGVGRWGGNETPSYTRCQHSSAFAVVCFLLLLLGSATDEKGACYTYLYVSLSDLHLCFCTSERF